MFGFGSFEVSILAIFILVIVVLALLMPIFVLQIRNSARRIEKQLAEIVERL